MILLNLLKAIVRAIIKRFFTGPPAAVRLVITIGGQQGAHMFSINKGETKPVVVSGVDSDNNPTPITDGTLVTDPTFGDIVPQPGIPDGTFKFNLTATTKAGTFTLQGNGRDSGGNVLPAQIETGTIAPGPAVALVIKVG